ncbi:DNA topoisomerase [Xylaria nigripes]|nr:DNA topoisomerase [Xylaria nigripes]
MITCRTASHFRSKLLCLLQSTIQANCLIHFSQKPSHSKFAFSTSSALPSSRAKSSLSSKIRSASRKTMDSDMEDSAFDQDLENESDAYSPEPKPKAKATVKKATSKSTTKAAPKKLIQTTLKTTKAVSNKRAKPDTDDDNDDVVDSSFSTTPPSNKKQKKASESKKSSGKPLAEVENESTSVDGALETKSKSKTASETYQKLTQLEHILKRPDTYIGSIERTEQPMWVFNRETTQMELRPKVGFVPGLYKIFDEIVVNAADNKQRSSSMTYMKININRAEGIISVENNGTGIPVEIHEKEKVYVPELVFGHLLAGSNFDDTEKKTVGGRNGFGAKLCNVFSTEFNLECQDSKNGKRYKQTWRDNMTKMDKAKITSNKSADFVRVTFKPDWKKFGLDGIDDDLESLLYRRVYDMAGTIRGIKVYLNDEHIKLSFANYCGLYAKAIASERSLEEGTVPDSTVVLEDSKGHPRWEVAFAVSDGSFQQVSFVNSIATTSGGPHVNYIADQICESLLKTLTKKKKGHTLKASHIRNHIFIFVNCFIDNPAFNSQTKELMTTRPSAFGSKCQLSESFLKKIGQTDAIKNIIDFADAKADKLLAKSDGNKRTRISNAKLVDANLAGSKHGPECTLILTEGDSAKSLAVAGRAILDPDRFGVFPLRGKLLNIRDASIEQISKNQEIQNIKQFLGLKHKQTYTDTKGLRYGHLMIMADQDHDGTHIKGLLINFLQIQYPSLLRIPGFFQEFITPIVKVWQGPNPKKPTKSKRFYTQPEWEEWKKTHQAELHKWEKPKYYKGLGTSSNEDAQVYFNDLELHQKYFDIMKPDEADLFELAFSKKKADARKEWLGNFVPGTFLDHAAVDKISYDDFVNKEFILFSMADNIRSIPSVIDGLKPGQRKVLYACFKRNLTKDKKVIELAGYVSEQTAYHHGDVSLQQTIIGLAQNFVGSNNVNFLEPSGNFGSRLAGGADAASARYIYTRLSPFARKIFSPLDSPLLEHLNEEGMTIEPKNYMPIIPTVLVNGCDGIGTGWSTSIPNYHPSDIIRNLKRRMGRLDGDEEKPFETMIPWFRGWKGTATPAEPNRYQFNGMIHQDEKNPNEVIVTELPIRMWTDDFKAKLEDIIRAEKAPSFIKDYKEFNDHNNVHFEIQMDEKHMEKALEAGLLEKFKLAKQIATSNLVAFDTQGRIHKYDKVEEILEEFYVYRLEMYTKRKAHWLGVYHADYRKLSNQARFIQEIIDQELVVSRKKKAVIIEELRQRKYEEFVKNAEAKLKSEDENENENETETVKESAVDDDSRGYDYLLSMPIWSFTQERLDRLKDQIAKKQAEHDDLQALSEKDLWCRDLDSFEETWENQLKLDHEIASGLRRISRYRNKKAGTGRARKGKDDDDFVPTTARSRPGAKSTAKSTKTAEKKAKPTTKSSLLSKDKPSADGADNSDAFSDGDFAALKKKVPVKEENEDDAPLPVRSKRAAATKAKTQIVDEESESDEDDEMLTDIADLVKGVGNSHGDASNAKTSRLGLFPMSRPESSHGDSAALLKTKSKPSKASDFKFDEFDSDDETNYEMLAKPSPHRPTRKDDVDDYLSDDDLAPPAKTSSKPKASASSTSTSKPTASAAPAKARAKATRVTSKAKDKAPTAAVLSPAAKAYATKKSKPSAAKDDLDEDDIEMDDLESPPPRAAARSRPGRAAAAKSKPIYIDSEEDEDHDMQDDDQSDEYAMNDSE